jgi:hypothetical protein
MERIDEAELDGEHVAFVIFGRGVARIGGAGDVLPIALPLIGGIRDYLAAIGDRSGHRDAFDRIAKRIEAGNGAGNLGYVGPAVHRIAAGDPMHAEIVAGELDMRDLRRIGIVDDGQSAAAGIAREGDGRVRAGCDIAEVELVVVEPGNGAAKRLGVIELQGAGGAGREGNVRGCVGGSCAELKQRGTEDLEAPRHRGIENEVAAVRLDDAGVGHDARRIDGERAGRGLKQAGIVDARTVDRAGAGRVEGAGDRERSAVEGGIRQIQRRSAFD